MRHSDRDVQRAVAHLRAAPPAHGAAYGGGRSTRWGLLWRRDQSLRTAASARPGRSGTAFWHDLRPGLRLDERLAIRRPGPAAWRAATEWVEAAGTRVPARTAWSSSRFSATLRAR